MILQFFIRHNLHYFISFFHMLENLVRKLLIQFSLSLIISCDLILSFSCSFLVYFHQTIIESLKHEDQGRQWTQNVGSKPGKNPSKGKNPERIFYILIESIQMINPRPQD